MGGMTSEERRAQELEHYNDPKVGDYWHDMFNPIMLVVARTYAHEVWVLNEFYSVDEGHWSWDENSLTKLSLSEFQRRLTSSYSPKDRPIYNVGVNCMLAAVKAIESRHTLHQLALD